MVSKVFTAYDSKAEAYLPPFLMKTKGEALRAFGQIVNDPKHAFSQFPEDYTLFEIGEFDDSTGQYKMYPAKISLGLAIEFKRSEPRLAEV